MICATCGRIDWSKRDPPLYPPGRCRCVPAHRVNLRQLVTDEKERKARARAAAATRGVQLGLSLEE